MTPDLFIHTATLFIAARLIPIALLLPCLGAGLSPPSARLALGAIVSALVVAGVASAMLLTPGSRQAVLADPASWPGSWQVVALDPGAPLARLGLLLREVLAGSVIGFATAAVFLAARAGFHLVHQVLIGYRPREAHARALPTLGVVVGVAVFFAIDGHLMLIRAVAASYRVLPPGQPWLDSSITMELVVGLVSVSARVIEMAVAVAAPVLFSTALAQLAVGLVERVEPGLKSRAWASPIGRLLGLSMLGFSISAIALYLTGELRPMVTLSWLLD